MSNKRNIRVAIIGVGNCASSLVQGVHYYKDIGKNAPAKEHLAIPGIMHTVLGGYEIGNIQFSAAIDIDARKVGLDLNKAVFAGENNTFVFDPLQELSGIKVERGMRHDGIGKYLSEVIPIAEGPTVDVVQLLKDTHTDVVVNYLPVGSEEATKWYVEQILQAGCALVNCIPVFIASSGYWDRRFLNKRLPVIGDDIKSQVGATITHRALVSLFEARGVHLDRTYQLNFGGNTDFLNMLERERLESKKISKTSAVQSMLNIQLEPDDIHVGPSDYVPWLKDRKYCYIVMEGTTFGNVPLKVELKMEVWDSPNSAGVVIDAIRCARLALDRGIGGAIGEPSSYFMKHPPFQLEDVKARETLESWIDTCQKLQ